MNKETVFLVQFKAGGYHFFGSIAAIFVLFSPKTIGVSQQRLYDFDIDVDKPYENKTCTIRKGHIIRKPGKRVRPV